MSFPTDSAKYTSAPIALLDIVIGSTTLRYAKHDINVPTIGFYEGRAKSLGVIDSKLGDNGPIKSDVTVRLINTDGVLDDFLTSFGNANKNILRAKVTFRLLFREGGISNAIIRATFQFAELVGVGSDRVITLKFSDRKEDLFGNIRPPLQTDVLAALISNFSGAFSGATQLPQISDLVAPIAFGLWMWPRSQHSTQLTMLESEKPVARRTNPTTGFKERIHIMAVSPNDFTTGPHPFFEFDGEFFPFTLLTDLFDVTTYDLVSAEGYFALVAKIYGGMDSSLRVGASSLIDGDNRKPTPVEAMEKVVRAFSTKSSDPWIAANVDLSSFVKADTRTSNMGVQVFIDEEMDAFEYLRTITEPFLIDLYFNSGGKLAAHRVAPDGPGTTEYANALRITEADDIVRGSLRNAGYGKQGERNGLINVANVRFKVRHLDDRTGLITDRNTDSNTDHDRWVSKTIETERIADYMTATLVAEENASRGRDPRMVVPLSIPLVGAAEELGNVVHLTHRAVPGFSAGKYCILEGLRINNDTLLVGMILAEYDAELLSKPYILPNEDDWIVVPSGAVTLGTNAASAIITNSFGAFANVLPGDVLQIGGWPGGYRTGAGKNNLNCVILTKDSDAQLTLQAGGGEDGSIPSETETVEGAGWRIFRGQANRGTAGGSYTVQEARFGVLAIEADGFFRDDATAGFAHWEG